MNRAFKIAKLDPYVLKEPIICSSCKKEIKEVFDAKLCGFGVLFQCSTCGTTLSDCEKLEDVKGLWEKTEYEELFTALLGAYRARAL